MSLNYVKISGVAFLLSAVMLLSVGCGDNHPKSDDTTDSTAIEVDSNKSNLVKVNGQLFSVPSPLQTAMLIKQLGSAYNKEMLNPFSKSTAYSTTFTKALNLGVYGADLGYVTIYNQTQDAVSYLNSVKKLADDLGITGAFDKSTIDKFQTNLGNKDSLLGLVSVAYRASDAYLKNNERNNISALVLAGGWIEGLHLAGKALKAKNNAELGRRIGEQKSSLASLIKILSNYSDQPEYADLTTKLNELSTLFESVEVKYTFEKPSVDVNNKITTINSKTDISIKPEQIDGIIQKIEAIRNSIIG